MLKYTTRFIALFLLVTAVIACSSDTSEQETESNPEQQEQAEPVTPEEYIQQASFTNLEGDTVHVSDFRGKVVMIDFWETWCKPCLASFPTMQDLQEEYPDDFIVLAVTPGFTDSPADARSFVRENDYDFTFLYDSNGLHQKLEIQGIPYKVFVGADGKFIERSMGSHGPQEDYKMIKGIIEEHQDSTDVEGEI